MFCVSRKGVLTFNGVGSSDLAAVFFPDASLAFESRLTGDAAYGRDDGPVSSHKF
jgi:hypothetical protein